MTTPKNLLHIEEPRAAPPWPGPAAPAPREGWPLLRLGLRPFYLLAALFAALLPPLWLALMSAALVFEPALPPLLWHGHEMIFGVVAAAIVGFLFTAGRTWTGLATPTGGFLAAFALLWLAARVAALSGPYPLFFALDVAFLPLAAAVFFDLVVRSKNWRNLPLALLLMLLGAANLAFHAAHRGLLPLAPGQALHATVLLVVAVMSIVGGRVIPAFIGSAVPGSRPRTHRRIEVVLLPLTAAAVVLWLWAPHSRWTACALLLLACTHALRCAWWRPWVARGRPILWILPAAYVWIPLGLALLGAASLGLLPVTLGIHALTAGAMGALIVGMMSRTARGHTGRPLQPGRRERWAYGLVLAGAAVRVAAPLISGTAVWAGLLAAAVLWSGAFALLLLTLAPWLLAPRLDGKPG